MISSVRLIQGYAIETELHFEKRRTLAMRFLNRRLIIKAPTDIDKARLEDWLTRKEAWILKYYKVSEQSRLEDGKAWILNTQRFIEYKQGSKLDYHLDSERLRIVKPDRLSQERAHKQIMDAMAHSIILPILEDSIELTRLRPKQIQFKNLKSSWGRCSSKGVITLSLKLLECDPGFIQYVCVHELIHLRHMNHSKIFWQDVTRCLPEYKALKKLTPYAFRASL